MIAFGLGVAVGAVLGIAGFLVWVNRIVAPR